MTDEEFQTLITEMEYKIRERKCCLILKHRNRLLANRQVAIDK